MIIFDVNCDVGVLGLAPCHSSKTNSRYVTVISRDICMYCGRFVGPSLTAHGWSPRYMRKEKSQKFYIYSDVTHTCVCVVVQLHIYVINHDHTCIYLHSHTHTHAHILARSKIGARDFYRCEVRSKAPGLATLGGLLPGLPGGEPHHFQRCDQRLRERWDPIRAPRGDQKIISSNRIMSCSK